MNNNDVKKLCIELMKADYEEEVIKILKNYKLWDDETLWRYYGDTENNYSSAGNQADEAEAALIEKITNSRDAVLMNKCLELGIDPEDVNAPTSVTNAVAQFFEDNPNSEHAGQIREWVKKKREEIARNISIFITGAKPSPNSFPCINIADKGEGQTPLAIPNTILSLGKSIKMRIPFVHGKFNMGGTGALVYCGKNNIQLVISRRNPKLLKNSSNKIDNNWGFTIVRRFDPQGNITSSIYKYLAPVFDKQNSKTGGVLNFYSDTMPIFAKYNEPYCIESEWGTLIKLYEYETRFKQRVEGGGGLLRPLDLLAPDLGLPFRLHECRYNGKDKGSFEHQINGLRVRLFDQTKLDKDRKEEEKILENGYPTSHNAIIEGESFIFSLYVFKEDKALTYRTSDKGIIFTLNGQSQGWLDDRIFTRNKVALGFLKNSLFIIIDCSKLTHRGQERLFINDRAHLRKGPFHDKIISEIEDYLANHKGLAELQQERKRKLKSEKLDDSKPIDAVLTSVFKNSSILSKIFLKGERLANAFNIKKVKSDNIEYKGKEYPDFFKFKKINYGEILKRDAFINNKCRIDFETDAENQYFIRKNKPGTYKLSLKDNDGVFIEAKNKAFEYSLNLLNGISTLNIKIENWNKVESTLNFVLEVNDPMRISAPPFTNEFILSIKSEQEDRNKGHKKRRQPPIDEEGDDREKIAGIKYPEINPVYRDQWDTYKFNEYSAMMAIKSKNENVPEKIEFSFFINMDNKYLEYEIKENIKDVTEIKAQFLNGMALLGISLIYDDQQNKNDNNKYEEIEERINDFSRAMAPILIPMIKHFSDLDLKDELINELSG